jgi:hypothetical protein
MQVNRLQGEVLAAESAHASLEEIPVQQNDHINKLLNAEDMRTKQVTPELDAEGLGKEDALQQPVRLGERLAALHVAKQTKKRLSDGNKEQNAVPMPGGFETAVSAMKEHKTSVLVQEAACLALWILAMNDGNKVMIRNIAVS